MAASGTAPLAASGLTVLGIATGIDPILFLAGLAGGWWALSYLPAPLPCLARFGIGIISGLAGAWFGPMSAALAASAGRHFLSPWWPAELTPASLAIGTSFLIGLLAHRKLGPLLMRGVDRVEEATK